MDKKDVKDVRIHIRLVDGVVFAFKPKEEVAGSIHALADLLFLF